MKSSVTARYVSTEMKVQDTKKKSWVTPVIQVLNITKDTFAGSAAYVEGQNDGTSTAPRDPTPR